jgi:lysosomal Pro-X carboxypeptidase
VLRRFGVSLQPHLLAEKWGFGHLDKAGASHIVFTNGMNDGWSAGGVTKTLSPTLIAVNIADGAHHSDLSHTMPGPTDTPDVVEARKKVKGLLGGWLAEVQRLPPQPDEGQGL